MPKYIEVLCAQCNEKNRVVLGQKSTECLFCQQFIHIPSEVVCDKCKKKQLDHNIFCECGAELKFQKTPRTPQPKKKKQKKQSNKPSFFYIYRTPLFLAGWLITSLMVLGLQFLIIFHWHIWRGPFLPRADSETIASFSILFVVLLGMFYLLRTNHSLANHYFAVICYIVCFYYSITIYTPMLDDAFWRTIIIYLIQLIPGLLLLIDWVKKK